MLLADRRPGGVRIAARRRARRLRAAVDVDRVRIITASNAADFVVDAGNDRSVTSGAAAPADRLTRFAAFQSLLFGGRGTLSIAFVEARPNRPAQDTARRRATDGS